MLTPREETVLDYLYGHTPHTITDAVLDNDFLPTLVPPRKAGKRETIRYRDERLRQIRRKAVRKLLHHARRTGYAVPEASTRTHEIEAPLAPGGAGSSEWS